MRGTNLKSKLSMGLENAGGVLVRGICETGFGGSLDPSRGMSTMSTESIVWSILCGDSINLREKLLGLTILVVADWVQLTWRPDDK